VQLGLFHGINLIFSFFVKEINLILFLFWLHEKKKKRKKEKKRKKTKVNMIKMGLDFVPKEKRESRLMALY